MVARVQQVYTPEDVADLLRVNIATVRRLLLRGDLKAFKVGTMWRITPEALQAFMGTASDA